MPPFLCFKLGAEAHRDRHPAVGAGYRLYSTKAIVQGALRSPYPLHHTSSLVKDYCVEYIYIWIYFQYLDILTIYMNYHLFKHPGVFSQDLHMVMSYQKIVSDEISCWRNNSHPTQQSRRILSSKDFRSPCSCGITPNHHFCGKPFFFEMAGHSGHPGWINRQPLE